MAKHLKQKDLLEIAQVIHSWPNAKFTWDEVCVAAGKILGAIPARQTLSSHAEIRTAYLVRKRGKKVGAKSLPLPSSLQHAAMRIGALRHEVDGLRILNARLLERFVKWQYNAHKRGISEAQLEEDLPKINRGRTESKEKARGGAE